MTDERDPFRFDAQVRRLVEIGKYELENERIIAAGLRAVGLLKSDQEQLAFLIGCAQTQNAIGEIRRENMRKEWERVAALPWWKRWRA